MQDVTALMNRYRECARGLWNNFLRDSQDVDVADTFESLCDELFSALVLAPLGEQRFKRGASHSQREPFPFLRVEPRTDHVPVMVSRSAERGGYWDDPLNEIGPQQARLLFNDYFDWDSNGYIDLLYFKVKVADFPSHAHLVGREALLEVQYGKVFFDGQGIVPTA